MRTRVAPAVVHFLQGLVVLLLVLIPIAPAWVVLLAVFSPLYPLGFISSDDAVGLPEGYRRWRHFPLKIPMVLLILSTATFSGLNVCLLKCFGEIIAVQDFYNMPVMASSLIVAVICGAVL